MIEVIEDVHRYRSLPPEAHEATVISDYVPIRQHIQRSLLAGNSLKVIIRHPTLAHWFADLRQYPPAIIRWDTVDPIQQFTEHFNCPPPVGLSASLIVELNIKSIPAPIHEQHNDPVSWILHHRLGNLWGQRQPDRHHLLLIVAHLAEQTTPLPAQLIPLVTMQLQRWASVIPEYLALQPQTLVQDSHRLLARWALRNYSEDWLTAQGLNDVPLVEANDFADRCIPLLADYAATITEYWSRIVARYPPSRSLVEMLLDQMSGLSMAELGILVQQLNHTSADLDIELLAAVRRHFSRLGQNADTLLRPLEAVLPPPIPSLPEATWEIGEYLDWAANEYMPYFAWVVRTHQPRTHQQECAIRFSDWLVQQYPHWLTQADSPLLTQQFTRLRNILATQTGACVIWLVIDGLTWWQGMVLRDLCIAQGLHPQEHATGIAALPSITSVSKRVLVTGMPAATSDQRSIAQIAHDYGVRSGLTLRVVRDLEPLAPILHHTPKLQVLLVLYNMIDTIAHQQTGFTDDEGIRGYLQQMVNYLAQCKLAAVQYGRDFHVLIGSDHGSTRLPDDAPMLNLPYATTSVDDLWQADTERQPQQRSTRAAVVTQPHHPDTIDRTVWYVLEPNRYQLDTTYLVPRGYSYIKKRPVGWSHGGLTPEEVLVPLLHLTPTPPIWLQLEVSLSGQLQANVEGTLELRITNPNTVDVQVVRLMVANARAAPPAMRVPARSTKIATVHMGVSRSTTTIERIHWVLDGTSIHGQHTQEGIAEIPIRRFQTLEPGFDDMFR